jgi:transposase
VPYNLTRRAGRPPVHRGGKGTIPKRDIVTPLRPLYKVENAFARLGTWRRLSWCYEQTSLGGQTWMEVACVAYLCGRLRVEPT